MGEWWGEDKAREAERARRSRKTGCSRKEWRDRIVLDREGKGQKARGQHGGGWSTTKYKRVGKANDIHSHSSVGSGCCANEPQRRREYQCTGHVVPGTERACYACNRTPAYIRACVRQFRAGVTALRGHVDLYPFYCRRCGILGFTNTASYVARPDFRRTMEFRYFHQGKPEQRRSVDVVRKSSMRCPYNASSLSTRVFPRSFLALVAA